MVFRQAFEAPQSVPLAKPRTNLAYAQTDQWDHSEDKENHAYHFGPCCETPPRPTAVATP